jgi:hypothetical protein
VITNLKKGRENEMENIEKILVEKLASINYILDVRLDNLNEKFFILMTLIEKNTKQIAEINRKLDLLEGNNYVQK